MSLVFNTVIITDNELDCEFIDGIFNFTHNDYISPIDDIITTNLHYDGEISISNELNVKKKCYSIESGNGKAYNGMFKRSLYAYYDLEKKVAVNRQGEEAPDTVNSTKKPLFGWQSIPELEMPGPPPIDETKILFDYILSLNKHFYILFHVLDLGDYECYERVSLESLIDERKFLSYKTEKAQEEIIKMFNTEDTMPGGIYDNEVVQEIVIRVEP